MKTKIKLKPCPLCCDSTRDNMEVYTLDADEGPFRGGCGSCGCSTPKFSTPKEAEGFWNTRTNSTNYNNCPMCDSSVELLEYKVHDKQIEPFFQYKCNSCGFSGGISKNKELIVDSWTRNRR